MTSPTCTTVNPDHMRENARTAVNFLKAISNENRLMILCYLGEREFSVSQLNDCLDLSQSALSQHLAVLRKDGLVTTRKEAQTVYYSLASEEAKELISLLHKLFCPAPISAVTSELPSTSSAPVNSYEVV
ncbi:ArsR/SmtB family transcription factor [Zooshikella harenae]|uniref:Winged helix-turn-helix transcriptional regulator n=1 Tax=Zooshikella harenae TaxID=2827238 RepID=A0ABS5Z9M0_9GAMM|nr:metalloregulator ArsR/SmtB family transcription factor [Zooshikella harenae]MBU2710753.1 winged helix-turn-helix transcriptional regulator [Zooshikella harenae]